jgi:hypothetical protein
MRRPGTAPDEKERNPMAGTNRPGIPPRSARRRRFTAATAAWVAFTLASASVAVGEPLVGTGQDAEGTYAAVAVTGNASSSQGLAASATGSSYGEVEVEGTNKVVTVDDPISGQTMGIDNTGDVGSIPMSADQALDAAYQPPPEVVAAKEQAFAKLLPEIEYQLAALQYGLDPTLADRACPDGRCPARTKSLWQPYTHQWRAYYCGPASTAAVLWQQTNSEWNQDALASRGWLNTTTDGTIYGSITKVLNNVFSDRRMNLRYMHSELSKNSSPSTYMTKLVSAVDYYDGYNPHSIVNNVRTDMLDYWGDKRYPAWHFNVSHGYDLNGSGWVNVTEIYNSAAVGSKRATNPFGQRWVPLSQVHGAVMANKRIVIW